MRKPDEYAKKISKVFPKSLHLSKSTEICTCSLGTIDWLKNFLNFHNSGRQTNLKSIRLTSNRHSTMDDLESEDYTTRNPNEQDLAFCEGENANLRGGGGAAKQKPN